ncbi:MAG: protein kinase domain-containing protein [Planctomycetota bacterium]
MQLTTAQIWERIHAAGMATPEECRQWAKAVSESLGPTGTTDPAALIKELVQQDKLSPYQANVLYRGLSHPLQLGKLRVTRSLETQHGDYWYEGEDPASARWSAFPPKAVWMVAIPDEKLVEPQIQDWPPSLGWAQQHCQVQSPHLDRWLSAGATLKHLYAVCESLQGLTLSEMLAQGPLASKQAYRLLRDVSMGLKFLHHHRLVHGHLSTHSILWNEMRGFLLLRDPLFPPRSPYHSPTLSVLGGINERVALAAPELFVPGALPNIQSDLYALGCLWLRSLTGNWPFDPGPDAPPEVWAKLHAQVPVVIPSRLPEVQKKCLLHLLAKDPAVRFSGIDQLLRALDQLVLADDPQEVIANQELPTDPPTQKDTPSTKPTEAKPTEAKPSSSKPAEVKAPEAKPASVKPEVAKPLETKPPEAKPKVNKPTVSKVESKPVDNKLPQADRNPAKSTPIKAQVQQTKPVSLAATPTTPAPTTATPTTATPTTAPPTTPAPTTPTPTAARPTTATPTTAALATAATTTSALASPKPTATKETKPKPTSDALPSQSSPVANSSAPSNKKPKKKKTAAKPFGPRKKPKRPVWFMPLIVGCSLLLLSVLLLLLKGNSKGLVTIQPKTENKAQTQPLETTKPSNSSAAKAGAGAGGIDPMLEYYNVKSDDTGVPWIPPSIGAPYSTEMLPPGLEALLMISPDCWTQANSASRELADWWKSVYAQGPELSDLLNFATDSLASVSVAWYPGESTGSYRKTYRLGWKEPKPLDALIPDIDQWSSQEIQSDNKKYRYWTKEHQGQSIALITDDFTSKANEQVKRIAIGSFELLKPLLDSQGKSGPLRRQLDAILQNTDSRADATFLAAPSFVFVDGKQMFGQHSEKVIGLMREVIDDRVQAVMVRTHFEPQLYVEYRMFGNDIQSAPRDAIELKRKLDSLAENVESQLTAQPAAVYWRAIANRFPQMLRSINKYARSGAEDGQVVFNVYLPKEAATNLAIGSWMALQGGTAAGPVKVATAPKPTNNAPKSIDEMLDSKISLRIEQESLEVVLQAIANELKESHTGGVEALPMAINGTAFQKDGITRNQQVRNFEYKDTPVREILTALCRRANPVTTVQKATEKDQKVVWLLLDDPNTPSKKKLDMSTRAWSESNQATLPKEFVE